MSLQLASLADGEALSLASLATERRVSTRAAPTPASESDFNATISFADDFDNSNALYTLNAALRSDNHAPAISPWLGPDAVQAADPHDYSDDLADEVDEEDEDEDQEEEDYSTLHDDEVMPDIQRGSIFETNATVSSLADAIERQSAALREALAPGANSSDDAPAQHRQPYSDPSSFVYGDHSFRFPSSAGRSRFTSSTLRRTAAASSTLRSRRDRAADDSAQASSTFVPDFVRRPFTPADDSTTSEARRRRPGASEGRSGAETRGQTPVQAPMNAAYQRDMEQRYAEYTGWAPGTNTSEHQRPDLNTLRAIARGHRAPGPAGDGGSTRGQRNGRRSAAMTALEHRYWTEQARQLQNRATQADGEQEAASRRIQVREANWQNPPIVDINGHPVDTGAINEVSHPRSIVYPRPSDRHGSSRADIYDIHRELEESREVENDAIALERRIRREAHRARRGWPSNERRDEIYREPYDQQRERYAEKGRAIDAARKGMEASIRYLERLRHCESNEEAYMVAEDCGMIDWNGRAPCDLLDFVLDSRTVKKTPWSTWLVPGTRFTGFQQAVTATALPHAASRTTGSGQSMRLGESADPREYRQSRIPTATTSSNPNSSSFRPSWIESIMQRDRHSGANPNNSSILTGATLPPSGPASLNLPTIPNPYTYVRNEPTAPNTCTRSEHEDTWPVKVTITSVDYEKCTLTGTMEAMNVPNKSAPPSSGSTFSIPGLSASIHAVPPPQEQTTITTFLEGEIIDMNTHSLETRGFNADSAVDSTYWRRLDPFKSLSDKELASKLVSNEWLSSKIGPEWVLMRWKERCFVTPSDAGMGLTISGFYYISLQRVTGRIEGLYYDPQSSPYQHLCLMPPPVRQFSAYTFQ